MAELRPRLQIDVLGPVRVLVDGSPLVVDTRKALAILALLVVDRRPYARDELAALLWPESDDESARGALRRTLSVLKSGLGGRWLRVDRSQVALDDADGPILVDLDDVEAAARHPGALDLPALTAAVARARGPLLAGFSLRDSPEFDDWRAVRAVHAERLVAGVLDQLSDSAAAAGEPAIAIQAAARRVDVDPLDEAAHRRLMQRLAEAGDPRAAIRQYRTVVAVLERELGVPPLAETTDLYEAIREGRGPTTVNLAPAVRAMDITTTPGRDAASAGTIPFVGRDEELQRLFGALEAAASDGRVAVVAGEAGIGKSRLADELAARAVAAGGLAIASRSNASEAGIAFGPILDLLRGGLALDGATDRLRQIPDWALAELDRLVPLADELMGKAPRRPFVDSPASKARLLDAVAAGLAALVAGPRPGLIRLDDAQWADETTLEAILYLARRLAGRSILLVVAWRPEDLDGPAAAFADRLVASAAPHVVELQRLSEADVERLVAASGTAVNPAALFAESEGLPLYVVEAIAADPGVRGAEPPRGMRALLRERLASVGEAAGQVLGAAAVVGRSFDLPTLHEAAGRSDVETIAALEELVRRGLVRETSGSGDPTWDFAHERLREAAYDATSLARRRLLHRRVADALRSRTGRDADPGRLALIARHERSAGRDAEAAIAFRDAGLQARALYAHPEAVEAFDAAIALGHPDVASLQAFIGEARAARGDYPGAIAALEASAALAEPAVLPEIELRLGRVHARRGDIAAATSHLDAALAGLGDPAVDAVARRALAERSLVALRAGDGDLAFRLAGQGLVAAEADGDQPGVGAALRMLGLVARQRGDLPAARESLARSLDLAADDPDPADGIAARNALALVEGDAGRHEAAVVLLGPALEACRRTGERHLEAAVENNLADRLHALGRDIEAMEHLKRAVAIFADLGGPAEALDPEVWKLVAW